MYRTFKCLFLFFFVFLVACQKSAPESDRTNETESVSKTENQPVPIVKYYAFLANDYRGVPVLLVPVEKAPAPFEAHQMPDGRIERIRKLDDAGQEIENWMFVWNAQNQLMEVLHQNAKGMTIDRLQLEVLDPKTCVTVFGKKGRWLGRSCFVVTKSKVDQTRLSVFGVTLEKFRLEVDERGLMRRSVALSRQGERKGVTLQFVQERPDGVFIKVQTLAPQGALESWVETQYDLWGRMTAYTEKYEDGSIKTRTEYEYTGSYIARGNALTIEGTLLTLDVQLDRFGHRIRERKYNGPRLVEDEQSEYDDEGRLLIRQIRDENKVVTALERYVYDASGMVVEMERYRGNIHQLECTGDRPDALVTTKLPALEKARVQYDSLGRPTHLERIYLHQTVDRETVTYGKNGVITTRQLHITDESEPQRTEYEYDSAGNLLKVEIFYGQTRTEVIRYQYNASGQLVKQTTLHGDETPLSAQEWPDGSVVQYFYDTQGRLTEERWSHADGTPALTNRSTGCTACSGAGREHAVSRITWKYNETGLLLSKRDFASGETPVLETNYTYDAKGRETIREVRWPKERKVTRLVTTYAPGGWVASTQMSTEIASREVSREVRTFDRALLVKVEKYQDGKWERTVERIYKEGKLIRRVVSTPKEGVVSVTLTRNSAGLVVEETSVDDKGRPAVAQDIFENRYTRLVSTYNEQNRIVSAAMIHEPMRRTTRTEFFYDAQGRPAGRKVYVDQKLQLEIEEHFDHPFLGPYGIATRQVRATVDANGGRQVTSYQVLVDTTYVKKTRATLTLPKGETLELTKCRCTNCGLTLTLDDF